MEELLTQYPTAVSRRFLFHEVEALRKKVQIRRDELQRRHDLHKDIEIKIQESSDILLQKRKQLLDKENTAQTTEAELSELQNELASIKEEFHTQKTAIEEETKRVREELSTEIERCRREIEDILNFHKNQKQFHEECNKLEQTLEEIQEKFRQGVEKSKEEFVGHQLALKQKVVEKLYKRAQEHTITYQEDKTQHYIRFLRENNELEKRIQDLLFLLNERKARKKSTVDVAKVEEDNVNMIVQMNDIIKEIEKYCSYAENIKEQNSIKAKVLKEREKMLKKVADLNEEEYKIGMNIGRWQHKYEADLSRYNICRASMRRIHKEFENMLEAKRIIRIHAMMIVNFNDVCLHYPNFEMEDEFRSHEVTTLLESILKFITNALAVPFVSSAESLSLERFGTQTRAEVKCQQMELQSEPSATSSYHMQDLLQEDEDRTILERQEEKEIKICDLFDVETSASPLEFEIVQQEETELAIEEESLDDEGEYTDEDV